MKAGLALFVGVALVFVHLSTSNAKTKKISEDEKGSARKLITSTAESTDLRPALRNCMDRNGRALPHNCVEALIDAGEVSRSEVERRKKSGK